MSALVYSHKYEGTTTFSSSDTAKSISLPASVNRSRCLVFIEPITGTLASYSHMAFEYWLDPSGATLEIERQAASDTVIVAYKVLVFTSGFTNNWYRFTTGASWGTSYVETISSVNLSRTAVIGSYRRSQNNREHDNGSAWFRLSSTTGLEVNRYNGSYTAENTCSVQVVEFDSDSGVNVQQVDYSFGNTLIQTYSISAVTPAQSSVFGSGGSSVFNVEDWFIAVQVESLTSTVLTLRNNRNAAAPFVMGTAFVIDWGANVSVQSGRTTATSYTSTTLTQAISTVTSANSVVLTNTGSNFWFQHYGLPSGSGNYFNRLWRSSLSSNTQITFTRVNSTSAGQDQGWQVLDFTNTMSGGGGTQNLTAPYFQNTNNFYNHTIVAGQVTLNQAGVLNNTNTFYSHTISTGDVELEPPLLTNNNTFYSHTISAGTSVLSVSSRLDNTNTFYTHTITGDGIVLIQTDRFDNTNTFYGPTITVGSVTLSPNLLTNTNTFYSHTINSIVELEQHTRFDNTNTFYTHTISLSELVLRPELLLNENIFFEHHIVGSVQTLTQTSLYVNPNIFYDVKFKYPTFTRVRYNPVYRPRLRS